MLGRLAMLGLLAVPAFGARPSIAGFVHDPARYASPSGRWTLLVEPSNRDGGPASCTGSLDGRPAWSVQLPFTFWSALITEEGRVAGYAHTWGSVGHDATRDMIVAVLDAAGRLVKESAFRRDPGTRPEEPSTPRGIGIFAAPDQNRFVLRVMDATSTTREAWWSFRFSDGSEIGRIDPSSSIRALTAGGRLVCATHVPSSPFDLAEWRYGTNDDAVFALVDLEARSPWNVSLSSDYAQPIGGPDEMRLRDWIARAGPIAATGPRTFALQSVAHGEKIRFEISDGADPRAPSVREVGRVPSPIRFDSPIDAGAEEAHLETLGVLHLDEAVGTTSSILDDVLVDPSGVIVTVDGTRRVVSVIEASGKLFYRAALGKDDFDLTREWGRIALADDGSVQIRIRDGWMRFDSAGRVVGRESREQGIRWMHRLARRGLADEWRFPTEPRIEFTARPLDARKFGPSIERRPDGLWLRGIVAATVGRDGTLAVVDAAGTSASGLVPPALCTYGPDGSPLEAIALPDTKGRPSVAVLDRWIVVEDRLALRFFERGGTGRLFRRPDAWIGTDAWASPDGNELWMVDLARKLVTRFAVH